MKQEQKILFQKGVSIDDTMDDDLYSMLVPAENDGVSKGGCRHTNNSPHKKANLRSPF